MNVWETTPFGLTFNPKPTLFIRWDEFGRFHILGEDLPSKEKLIELYKEQKINVAEADKMREEAFIRECEFHAKLDRINRNSKIVQSLVFVGLFILLLMIWI